MSQFNIIEKILILIKGDLKSILQEAKTLETELAGVGDKLNTKKSEIDQWIESIFSQLSSLLDVTSLQNIIQSSEAYNQLSNVPLYFKDLFSFPANFDANDAEKLNELVKTKIQLLNSYLSNLNIDGLDTNGILNDIQQIILELIDIPANTDLSSPDAVLAFKVAKMEKIKPMVFDLVEKISGVQLTGGKLDNAVTAFDSSVDTILNSASAGNSEDISTFTTFLTNVKPDIPKIAKDLDPINATLGNNFEKYGTETVDYLQAVLPKIEKELEALNPDTLNLKTIFETIKRLFPIINNFANEPQLAKLASDLEKVLPKITLEGITEDDFINQLEQILSLPDDQKTITAGQILQLFQTKIPALYQLLKHVKISDEELNALMAKASTLANYLFSPFKDLEHFKLPGVISSILEVITNVINQYFPTGKVMDDIADVSDKLKVVWDFLDENGLLIPIKFKLLKSNGANVMQNQFVAAANQAVAQTGASQPNSSPSGSQQASTTTKIQNPTQPNADSSDQNTGASESTGSNTNSDQQESWLSLIEGVLKSHVNLLPSQEQELAQNILSGNLVQTWKGDFMKPINDTIDKGNQAWNSIKSGLLITPAPTSAQAATLLFDQIKGLVDTVIANLKSLINTIIDKINEIVQLAIKMLLAIKIPKANLVEMIPGISVLEDVNLICLFVATPKWAIEKLLKTKKHEILDWI